MLLFQTVTQGNTEFLFNSSVILLLALGTILAFFAWAWYLTKREGKPFGEVMSLIAVHQNESIFVGIIMLIFLAEGVLAASVHAPGEIPTPPLPRFLAHICMSFVGAVSSVTLIRDIASVFAPKVDLVSRMARILLVFGVLVLALGVPLGNAVLISAGLGEDLKFYLFYLDYLSITTSHEEYMNAVRFYGGTENYQSWGSLSYVMKSTIFLTICHMMLTLIEGCRNISSKERRDILMHVKKESPKDEDDKKREERQKRKEDYKGTAGEEQADNKAKDNFKKLLIRVRYDGAELDKKIEQAYRNLTAIDDRERRLKFATRVAELVNKINELDKSGKDEAEKRRLDDALKAKIRKLFSASPKNSKVEEMGLGITLKNEPEGED